MNTNEIKILDCTLRDGGYYNLWDFDETLVSEYCTVMDKLPVDCIEIGYKSPSLRGYYGKFFYTPQYLLERCRKEFPNKQIALMLNEKDISESSLPEILSSCKGHVDMFRMAIDPKNFKRSLRWAEMIRQAGFKVGMNVMYLSKWKEIDGFIDQLHLANDYADVFSLIDSFGSMFPQEVTQMVGLVKQKVTISLGFHGHDNIEMAFANALAAWEAGCEYVDVTMCGMGRGAGNLKTELMLAYLFSKKGWDIPFNELSTLTSSFEILKQKYEWGTSLPYMISGMNSLPQKDVMEWMSMKRYKVSSIIRALQNQKEKITDNLRLPFFISKDYSDKDIIVIGGGNSIQQHYHALCKFMEEKECIIVYTSSKYVDAFSHIKAIKYYCLVGSEGIRLEKKNNFIHPTDICVLPPFPRTMGTVVPDVLINNSVELENCNGHESLNFDSPLALALEIAIRISARRIFLAGFDGYDPEIDSKQFFLMKENQGIIDVFSRKGMQLISLTPSRYSNLELSSVYAGLM